ncbi:MAG TPA: right-handed parallel beta-helix repeat-containing protein, partial [Bryobacteraceae bacterium]
MAVASLFVRGKTESRQFGTVLMAWFCSGERQSRESGELPLSFRDIIEPMFKQRCTLMWLEHKLTAFSVTLALATLTANGALACSQAGSTGLTTKQVLTSNQQLTGVTVNAVGCDIGIYIGPGTDTVLISGVTVSGANEHGIFVQDAAHVTIQYSVVTGNGVAGHACPPSGAAPPTCIAEDKGIELVGTSNSVVTHNVVSHNRADGGIGVADDGPTDPGAPGNFPGISHGAKNVVVSDNLIIDNSNGC